MSRGFIRSISEKNARVSMFVFFSLLFFSAAFFVFADDATNGKNIFQDSDQDGLSNDEEKLYGTDAFNKDTDGDGYSDGVEVESGYDPLKKAPGDKITKEVSAGDTSTKKTSASSDTNMTEQVTNEIAVVLKTADSNGEAVTLDQIDESVQKILSGNTEEVTLPEVDIKDIKIKKAPSKNLSDKKRAAEEKKDVLEYLTVMSYLIANNSPKAFHTEDDMAEIFSSLSSDSISALASGNMQYLNELSKRGEKMLEETKDIEVPEAMLDVHVKALKMAKYAAQLKSELKPTQDDPISQIATLSKAQGFISAAMSFSDEVNQKLQEYGIDEIPIDL